MPGSQIGSMLGFLAQFPNRDGIFVVSEPRVYQHREDQYDAQYGIDRIQLDAYRREGEGLMAWCTDYGYSNSGPVIEIGCGTGRLSLALFLSGSIRELMITDASPAFCSITARKIAALRDSGPEIALAALRSEDLDRLPAGTFSMVILRSTLHHIGDISGFFRACARILRPGGLLAFEEPCYEGYLLMGAMTQFAPGLLRARGVALSEARARQIEEFVTAMQFYARRDIDKTRAEDKHLFRPDELIQICHANGMEMHLFPNRVFANIDKRAEPLPPDYFERFYMDYLKYAMSWDQELLDVFDQHVRSYFRYFACLAAGGALPYTYAAFLCRKRKEAA